MIYRPSLIVAFITILGFFFASMAPAQVTKIKVGYSSIGVGQSLVWVAKEAGLFKENGLDVQLIFIGSTTQRQKACSEPAGRVIGFYPQGDSQENRIGPGQRRGDHSEWLLAGQNGGPSQRRCGRDCAYLRGDDGRQENGL